MSESPTDPQLNRLVYASAARTDLKLQGLQSILEASEKNNARDNITGALFFSNDFFLQILEGEREPLTRTFNRISQDDRHTNICLIEFATSSNRIFKDWAMRHLAFDGEIFKKVINSQKFIPHEWSANQCFTFFVKYSALISALK